MQYPQFSADGLPITYVPNPLLADGKPVDSQWKEPVRTYTDGNITLSGLQTVNGVALMEGDRVLVKDQIDSTQNGIWIASAGSWYRAPDMRLWPQFVSAVVSVEEGFGAGLEVWITNVDPMGTLDVTPVNWVPVTAATGTIPTFTPLRALVTNAVGEPAASPTTSAEIAFVHGVTSPIQTQFAALSNQASSAFTIAVAGTNAAAAAQSSANSAQSTANSAFSIAVIGTNTGTAALNAAATAQSTANSAFSVAMIGTNTGSAAYSYGSAAYALAVAGTNIGSLAYTVATALGDKYVRTTRFASIGAGTSGAVALPPNSTVVLDDFGGGVDAVVTTISAGRPTFSHAFTAAGDMVTTSFDAGGNYTLSGAPSAYPVALVYRVRQKLSDFDSTSSDIIGDYDVEGINSIQGTVDQVYVNGSVTPQYGAIKLTTPPAWALAQIGTNTGTAAYTLAQVGSNLASEAWALANAGTIIPPLSTLPDVLLTNPTAMQHLMYTGSVWVNGDATAVISPTSVVYYLNDVTTGTDALNKLTTLPIEFTEAAETVAMPLTNVAYAVDKYMTDTMLNRTGIDAGIWRFQTYAAFANAGRNGVSIVEVYTRSISGAETFLFSGTSPLINVIVPTLFTTVTTQGSFGISLTDKLVAKYYFQYTAGGATSATLYHSGTAHASYIETPLAVHHNDLAGLQGGSTNQFYHVTLDQHNALADGLAHPPSDTNRFVTQADLNFTVVTSTSGTTLVPATPTRRVYFCDSSTGNVVIALPNTLGWDGVIIDVKKVSTDGNMVIIRSQTGTQTVDGSVQQSFTYPYTSLLLTSDGANWFIF